jgi:GNAT superfamily N-acetyltransferase
VIYLRAADRYDALSLADLRAASLAELEQLPAADVAQFITRAARAMYVLFRDERIVAWLACDAERAVASSCAVFYDRLPYPDGSRHAEICGVYVRPKYRQRGLASELVREVVCEARALGARKTFLRPSPRAKSMYARLGFVDADLMTHQARSERTAGTASRLEMRPSPEAGGATPLSGYAVLHEHRNNP